jgi:hypothetical protein
MNHGQTADPIIEVDILDFFRTGSFGAVGFGMSRAGLKQLLGPADDIGVTSRKERYPTIFKYGDIEFYINPAQDRLYGIQSDYFTILQGNARLQLQMHGIDSTTTLSQMKEILQSASITFSERTDQFEGKRLVTQGNVVLGFGEIASDGKTIDHDGCLNVISRFNHDVLVRQ